MMDYQAADHHVEGRVRILQFLDQAGLKNCFGTVAPGLYLSSLDHFWGGINSVRRARWSYILLRRQSQVAGPAAHVQNLVPRFDLCHFDDHPTIGSIDPE